MFSNTLKSKEAKKNLFVTDLKVADDSGSWLRRAVNLIIVRYVVLRLKLMRRHGSVEIFTNSELKSIFIRLGIPDSTIFVVEPSAYFIKNSAEFQVLHRFADELNAQSLVLGGKDGVCIGGTPVSDLLEARWSGELFDDVLWYLDSFAKFIGGKKFNKIVFCGHSSLLPYLAQINKPCAQTVQIDPPLRLLGLVISAIAKIRWRSESKQARDFAKKELRKQSPSLTPNSIGGRKRLLVVATINRSVERLLPAMECLKAYGYQVNIIGYARVSALAKLAEQDARCYHFGSFISENEWCSIENQLSAKALSSWAMLRKQLPPKKHMWQGIDLIQLADNALTRKFFVHLAQADLAYQVAERAMKKINPDLVLCFEDSELPRAVSRLAKKINVPSVGYIPHSPAVYPGLLRRSQEHLLVSGSMLHAQLSQWRNANSTYVVGDTLFDGVDSKKRLFDRSAFWAHHKLDPRKGVIGVISTWPDHSLVTLADIKNQFAKAVEVGIHLNRPVAIKLHPLQDESSVKNWLIGLGVTASILRNCDLMDFCFACDVIVAPVTTAVMQAMMAKVPVVYFQSKEVDIESNVHADYGFSNQKGIRCIAPGENATEVLADLLLNPQKRAAQMNKGLEYISKHVGEMDGLNSRRFVESLDKCLSASNRYSCERTT